jgi:O-Antigen ligase
MFDFLKLTRGSIINLIALHAAAGMLFAFVPSLTFYWQISILGYGLLNVFQTRDVNGQAALWSSYLAGMEVFLRMTGQSFYWEFAKYGIVALLAVGMVVSDRPMRPTYFLYFLLLTPSILIANYTDLAQARDMISFNLSGPLCLATSSIYFYRHKVTGTQLLSLVRALILPVIALITYLVIQTPDISSIDFESDSNFTASGGYGPNQVSLILGICIFFIVVLRYYGVSFSGFRVIDYLLIIILLFRALITFSRGGIFGASVALGAFMALNILAGFGGRRSLNMIMVTVFVFSIAMIIWSYTNSLTENALEYRYAGINYRTGKQEEYTTGRVMIMRRDLNTFLDNPVLGVGPGIGKLQKFEGVRKAVVAHSEWSRMLAEHGSFGLIALLMLIFVPFAHTLSAPQSVRPLLFAIFILAIFSMIHAAMRLSIIAFLYSLALIVPLTPKMKLSVKGLGNTRIEHLDGKE